MFQLSQAKLTFAELGVIVNILFLQEVDRSLRAHLLPALIKTGNHSIVQLFTACMSVRPSVQHQVKVMYLWCLPCSSSHINLKLCTHTFMMCTFKNMLHRSFD